MTWTKARIREPFVVSKYAKRLAHIPAAEDKAIWFRGEFRGTQGATRCGLRLSSIRAVREIPEHLELCDRCALADLGPVVYTLYAANGVVLYVGCTKDPYARITWHSDMSEFWSLVSRIELQHHETLTDAMVAEAERIFQLQPPYNAHFTSGHRSNSPRRLALEAARVMNRPNNPPPPGGPRRPPPWPQPPPPPPPPPQK